MDHLLPKGGAGPPAAGDGAFERFLSAAIATIITIIFSWRMVDRLNEENSASGASASRSGGSGVGGGTSSSSSSFSSPSQLSSTASSRIPVAKNKNSSASSSSSSSFPSSLFSRALPFAPSFMSASHQEPNYSHSPSSSTSSSPSSSVSSSSSSRRQLPTVPAHPHLTEHQQRLLNERLSSSSSSKSKHSPDGGGITPVTYKFTQLKPIIRVPMDLPLCGDDDDNDNENDHNNSFNSPVDSTHSINSRNDLMTRGDDSSISRDNKRNSMEIHGDSPKEKFRHVSSQPLDSKNRPSLSASSSSFPSPPFDGQVRGGDEDAIDFRSMSQTSGIRGAAAVRCDGEDFMDVEESRDGGGGGGGGGGDVVAVAGVDKQNRFGLSCSDPEIVSPRVSCYENFAANDGKSNRGKLVGSDDNSVPFGRSEQRGLTEDCDRFPEGNTSKSGSLHRRKKSAHTNKNDHDEDNDKNSDDNDDDDDSDVREELREIESAFGISSEIRESYSSDRNSSRGVIEAATSVKGSDKNKFIDRNRSGSGSDIIYLDSSIEEEFGGSGIDEDDSFVLSASQDFSSGVRGRATDGPNPFLNVSWDSVPSSAIEALQGSSLDRGDTSKSLIRGFGDVDLRELDERIRFLEGRRVRTTDLDKDYDDDDDDFLSENEDEFYLAGSSSRSRPLGSFGRTSKGGETFTLYDGDDDDIRPSGDEEVDEYDDDIIIHDIDDVNFDEDDDQQPRELQSDEELFCCSLLEPIMEEDSEDFSSTSGSDFDPNSRSPRVLRRLVLQQRQIPSADTLRTDIDSLDVDIDNDDEDDDDDNSHIEISGRYTPISSEVLSPVIITSPSFTPRQANISLLEQTTPPLISPGLRSPRSPRSLSPLSQRLPRTSPGIALINSPPISNDIISSGTNTQSTVDTQPHVERDSSNTKHTSNTNTLGLTVSNTPATARNIYNSIERQSESDSSMIDEEKNNDNDDNVISPDRQHANPHNAPQHSGNVLSATHLAKSQTVTDNGQEERESHEQLQNKSSVFTYDYDSPQQQTGAQSTPPHPTKRSVISTEDFSGPGTKTRKIMMSQNNDSNGQSRDNNDDGCDNRRNEEAMDDDYNDNNKDNDDNVAMADFDRSVLDQYRITRTPPHTDHPSQAPIFPDEYNYLDHIRHCGSSVDGLPQSRSQQQLQQSPSSSPSSSTSTTRLSRSTGDILENDDKCTNSNLPPFDRKTFDAVLTTATTGMRTPVTELDETVTKTRLTTAAKVTQPLANNAGENVSESELVNTPINVATTIPSASDAVKAIEIAAGEQAAEAAVVTHSSNVSEARRNVNNNAHSNANATAATGIDFNSKNAGDKNRNGGGGRGGSYDSGATTTTTSTESTTKTRYDGEIVEPLLSSAEANHSASYEDEVKRNISRSGGENDLNTAERSLNVVCSGNSSGGTTGNGGAEPRDTPFNKDLREPPPHVSLITTPTTQSGLPATTHSTQSHFNDKRNTDLITEVQPCESKIVVDISNSSSLDLPPGVLDTNKDTNSDVKSEDNVVKDVGVNLNSFVQTFSTRFEGDEDLSQSESDESVQTVISRKLSHDSLNRKLSSDTDSGASATSGSGGSAGASASGTGGSNTNNNSSNNSPAHSSSSSSSSSSSTIPITIRTNPTKPTRRPLSDSLVYQNPKKSKTDDPRDRIVSEGGGVPFDPEEQEDYEETPDDYNFNNSGNNFVGVSSYTSGDNTGFTVGSNTNNRTNLNKNNFDLRAYQSYDNLASFGPGVDDPSHTTGHSVPFSSLKDRFADIRTSGLAGQNEEGGFPDSSANNGNTQGRLRNFSDDSDNSDYQYYPAVDEDNVDIFHDDDDDGDFYSSSKGTPGVCFTDDYVGRPHTAPVLFSSGGVYNNNSSNGVGCLDRCQNEYGPLSEFDTGQYIASRLSHIEEEEEEEESSGGYGEEVDDDSSNSNIHIPPSYSEISDYQSVGDSVTTATPTTTTGERVGPSVPVNTNAPVTADCRSGGEVVNDGAVDVVDGAVSGGGGSGGSSKPLSSVNTVVVRSNPLQGSDRTVVISKSGGNRNKKMESNRREYTFGASDGRRGYHGGDERMGDYGRGGEDREEEEEDWEEETVTETFIVPESREKVIQRTLQNVKDMLDKRNTSSEELERRRRGGDGDYDAMDVDFDEECQSTCTTTLIDVVSHDAMGFHGNDDESSGYRSAQDAVARTDRELKDKMGFQLDLEDFKMEDYNTESGWPIVRYIEKERAFVDEEGEDVIDNEQEEEEIEDDERMERPDDDRPSRLMGDEERYDYRRGGIEVGDDEEENEEFMNKPGQGFFYPQTENVQNLAPPGNQAAEQNKYDIPTEYTDMSNEQSIRRPSDNISKYSNSSIPKSKRDNSDNAPYVVHVEDEMAYDQQGENLTYEQRMELPYKLMQETIPPHSSSDNKNKHPNIPSHDDEWDDEPYKRRDRGRDRPRQQSEFPDKKGTDNQNNNTPYADRKLAQDLKYDDEKLERGDKMPESQTRPFHDPGQVHVVYPQSQTQTPQSKISPSYKTPQATDDSTDPTPASFVTYAQLDQGNSVSAPTAQVPESPTVKLAASEHFPRQLSGRIPVEIDEDFTTKEDRINLEMGASVKPPPPSQKIQEYSSSSEDHSEPSDSRGKPDEGFDSFLRGVPDFRKQGDGGYEEFVRDISDMDEIPAGSDENYGASSPTLKTPVSDGILSGNLISPCKKSNVFIFPKDNAKPGSKTHSSPSYVGEVADKTGSMNAQQGAAEPSSTENAPATPDFPRFSASARRSSSYSLYDSTGNVLNASFDESEMSGFSLEKYNAEPGSNRSRSSDGLNRSKSREGVSDSPRSRNSDLSASADSPVRDPSKSASPPSKPFYPSRNVGVSSEPALDVVIESSTVTPQLSPITPTASSSVLRSEPIQIPSSSSSVAPKYTTNDLPKHSGEPAPLPSSATSSGSGSPVRWSRVIAGSTFVPSFDEDTDMAQPQPSDNSDDVKPITPYSMEPVVIEMPQSLSSSKALPIFSADTPEKRSNFTQPEKSQNTTRYPSSEKNAEVEGPSIRPSMTSALQSAPRKVQDKFDRGDEEDDDLDEDDEEGDEEENKVSTKHIGQLKPVSQNLSTSLPHIGQLRNISYSLESAEDVYPPDTSSASAVTSPHMSSDSASALEVPTSSSTTTPIHQSRYSTAHSPASNIITTRLLTPSSMKGTPWAHAQFVNQPTPKKPKSLKEIKKKYNKPYKSVLQNPTSTTSSSTKPRPAAAPFVLPDQMLTPSRLKILYSRNQFLSEQNLQSEPTTSADEFKAHKDSLLASAANPPSKERRYTSNTKPKSMMYNSQEQLQRLKDMINSNNRPSRGRSESSLHECLHDNCILSEHGRREILDKTLSIDNMHADIFQNLRRLASEGDAGAYEDTYFPETSSDLYDLTFPSQDAYSLDRPASMSELHYSTISGSGPGLEPRSTTPSSRHSTGKGRFAGHRQYKKSKSLCTLETNLDDDDDAFATTSMVEEDGIKRVPSVHELRISKSLQKLNVPDWYSKSSLSKSGSCLLKYGSSSTMSSFQFSPSLISSPCTTPSSSTNVVIKTRVQPPTSARNLRSPRFPSKSAPTTPSFMDHHQDKSNNKNASVRLPSDKLRSQDKAKALMPIPIVPFDKIRAMFEKKTGGGGKPSEAAKSPQGTSPMSSPPTSPTSSSIIQPSFKPPQHSQPPKSLPLNGYHHEDDEDDNPENMPVPRIIVSPTEPHVKGILKKPPSIVSPTQDLHKRHSDIEEEPEPIEEPLLVRPVATRPIEASPSLIQTEPPPIPTSAVPERKPRLDTVLKEENMMPKQGDYSNVNTEAALRMMDESFSSEDGNRSKEKVSFSPQKEEPPKQQTPPAAKPRGFKFFKSLRSSSTSSSDDGKDSKGRKSPSSSSQKHSPKHQSPNTSYDSSGFPASPTRKIEVPDVLSKTAPNNSSTGPTKPDDSSVRLEDAPVVRSPPPIQDAIQQPTYAKPVSSALPTTPTSPTGEESKPEKKRWFPKPKDFRKTKMAKENADAKPPPVPKDPVVPEVRVEKPNDFEVNEMSYEPRRLRSSRSSDLDDSNVSERSYKSANTRPSELSISGRKPSIDSNVSFGKDLDRVSDRALAGDIDRTGRAQDLDRRPNESAARRDKGSRAFDLDSRSPSGRKDFDRAEPVRGSERRERPRDFDRREPARHSDRPPRVSDGRREPPINVDSSQSRPYSRDIHEHRRSTDLDRNSISSSGDPRYGSRDYLYRDTPNTSRPSARSTDTLGSTTPDEKPRSSGRWQPKPKGSRSSASPVRQDAAPTNSNGAPSAYRFPVEGSAFNSHKPNTPAGLNTPPTTTKMNHDARPSSPGDKSDKSVRGE